MKSLFILFISTLTTAIAFSIEGYWSSPKYDITILVEETRKGIRVKRLDKGSWRYYTQVGYNAYEDYQGNQYRLKGPEKLSWIENNSYKKLDFYRSTRPEYRDRYRPFDLEQLKGRWINESTGQKIRIKVRRDEIEVKADRGGWRTFRFNYGDLLVDPTGNFYQFESGKLIYTSENRDFIMKFIRY